MSDPKPGFISQFFGPGVPTPDVSGVVDPGAFVGMPRNPAGMLPGSPPAEAAAPARPWDQPIPLDPGGGENSDAAAAVAGNTATTASIKDQMLGPGAAQAPGFYRKEGESSSAIGGPGVVDAEFGSGPAALEQAYRDTQAVQEQRNAALGKHYDQVAKEDTVRAGNYAQRRQEEEAETQVRQQKLDQATQYYTNDLADQGKFWTNPGNIVSAIAMSLMPLAGGDPTSGIRLVEQAVQQDMANRQHAAASTLGALQSNLSGYHKIAGDRQSGDLLAQAEAHRMAAVEAERIGQKFNSPESKAKLNAVIQDQRIKMANSYAQFYKANLYAPAQKMDPNLHAARSKDAPGAWSELGKGQGNAPNPYSTMKTPAQDEIMGSPSHASSEPNGGYSSPTMAAVVKTSASPANAAFRMALNEKNPHLGDLYQAGLAEINLKTRHIQDPTKRIEEKLKLMKDAEQQVMGKTELHKAAGYNASISQLQQKMDIASRMESANGGDPDTMLDGARGLVPDGMLNYWHDIGRRFSGDPVTKAAKYKEAREMALQDLRSEIAGTYNNYIHSKYGGAVSTGERGQGENVIRPGMNMHEIRGFIRRESIQANAEYQAQLDTLTPVARTFYAAQHGVGAQQLASKGRPAAIPLPMGDGRGPRPPIGPDAGAGNVVSPLSAKAQQRLANTNSPLSAAAQNRLKNSNE